MRAGAGLGHQRRAQSGFIAARAAGPASKTALSGALNKGADADLHSVACASAGNCSAGGFYKDSGGHIQAFVANETAKVRRR